MSNHVTCPACQYTRKPTDDAPDWACPKCQKAYAKTVKQKSGFCKNHTSVISSWRCDDCGAEFCGECVKLLRYSGSIPVASCPECKRLCINIRDAEMAANEEREKNKIWKPGEFVYCFAGFLALMFGFGFDYYLGYSRGEADAKREIPYVSWYRLTVLDPKDDPPVKDVPVVHTRGGRSTRRMGYVAGHNAVVKEWLLDNKYIPPPPISKASDLNQFRHR